VTSRQLALACARACDDRKALDIVILHVEKLTFVTYYFVICTAKHPRQARAVAEGAAEALAAAGQRELGREGQEDGEWVLSDFGDVVLHVFSAEHRRFYDIETAWAEGKRVTWKPAAAKTPHLQP